MVTRSSASLSTRKLGALVGFYKKNNDTERKQKTVEVQVSYYCGHCRVLGRPAAFICLINITRSQSQARSPRSYRWTEVTHGAGLPQSWSWKVGAAITVARKDPEISRCCSHAQGHCVSRGPCFSNYYSCITTDLRAREGTCCPACFTPNATRTRQGRTSERDHRAAKHLSLGRIYRGDQRRNNYAGYPHRLRVRWQEHSTPHLGCLRRPVLWGTPELTPCRAMCLAFDSAHSDDSHRIMSCNISPAQ